MLIGNGILFNWFFEIDQNLEKLEIGKIKNWEKLEICYNEIEWDRDLL